MKVKPKWIRKLSLKIGSVFRKIYAPVLFWFAWTFSIKKSLNPNEKKIAEQKWNELYQSTSIKEFDERMRLLDIKWTSDALNGLYDITYYNKPWLNFIPSVVEKFGRDCDDFAYMTFQWMQRVGFAESDIILMMNPEVTSGHFIIAGKLNGDDENYIVKSNCNKSKSIKANTLDEAIKTFVETSWEEKDYVWVVYRKWRNK